jgi:hypothetical protein
LTGWSIRLQEDRDAFEADSKLFDEEWDSILSALKDHFGEIPDSDERGVKIRWALLTLRELGDAWGDGPVGQEGPLSPNALLDCLDQLSDLKVAWTGTDGAFNWPFSGEGFSQERDWEFGLLTAWGQQQDLVVSCIGSEYLAQSGAIPSLNGDSLGAFLGWISPKMNDLKRLADLDTKWNDLGLDDMITGTEDKSLNVTNLEALAEHIEQLEETISENTSDLERLADLDTKWNDLGLDDMITGPGGLSEDNLEALAVHIEQLEEAPRDPSLLADLNTKWDDLGFGDMITGTGDKDLTVTNLDRLAGYVGGQIKSRELAETRYSRLLSNVRVAGMIIGSGVALFLGGLAVKHLWAARSVRRSVPFT